MYWKNLLFRCNLWDQSLGINNVPHMNASLFRIAILLLIPFVGCSQNEKIVTPPDSMELVPITVVYDGDRPEDSLLNVSCAFVGDDAEPVPKLVENNPQWGAVD